MIQNEKIKSPALQAPDGGCLGGPARGGIFGATGVLKKDCKRQIPRFFLKSITVAMAGQVRNAVRLASLLASDKMKGGHGLVPQIMPREGLGHGPQWRVF